MGRWYDRDTFVLLSERCFFEVNSKSIWFRWLSPMLGEKILIHVILRGQKETTPRKWMPELSWSPRVWFPYWQPRRDLFVTEVCVRLFTLASFHPPHITFAFVRDPSLFILSSNSLLILQRSFENCWISRYSLHMSLTRLESWAWRSIRPRSTVDSEVSVLLVLFLLTAIVSTSPPKVSGLIAATTRSTTKQYFVVLRQSKS